MARTEILSFADVEAAGLSDWRQLFEALRTRFLTGDFATGLQLVGRIGELAEEANHHPDVDLRYPHVNVRLFSHDVFGVTSRDVDLARAISTVAAELGVRADPTATSVVEIALDTWDHEEIKPFWRAVLGMGDHPQYDSELRDLSGSQPTLWFQETERHDEPRQRFHLDVRVPPEVADSRIAEAIAAGGTLVTDEHAPRFWVLADAHGNKACVTTGRGRG
ncbi:MAG TPA: VOC family protein [Nocardioides sp.]|jgi:4a-hydroxytetrahydrobiopterin dehydratase|nr:VOC family protein [Nocardioides sp.]